MARNLVKLRRLRLPGLEWRVWLAGRSLPDQVAACVLDVGQVSQDDVRGLCGSGHAGLGQLDVVRHLDYSQVQLNRVNYD